ncbi:unnamed protein product [Lactuca virosa]|uniref:Uroporphyrinogen-III synthase n=1 Tax=Lactuca virosa TaxID=75947 RepID=A0AAU9L9J8_9ASTR|nr:unnamed protein product [Lactuca virosa]
MSQPEQRRESSLKYQTRCVQCYPNGTGYALSSVEEEGLSKRGFHITRLNTYTTEPVQHVDQTILQQTLSASVVAVASPSAVGAWVDLLPEPQAWEGYVACIGETTASAARKLGLTNLNLNGNLSNLSCMVGPIPVSIEKAPGRDRLKNAKHFHLADNQLSGDIRSELFRSDMTLIHVRLDSNSLDGIVPQNITNLKSVSKLYLPNNKLSGPVPNLIGMVSLFYV